MAELRIKVGASVDRSLTTAYQPLIEAARKARVAIEGELNRTATARARSSKASQSAEEKAAAATAKAQEKAAAAAEKAAEKAARAEVRSREKAERDKQRALDETARKAELVAARQEKAAQRAADREAQALRKLEERRIRKANLGPEFNGSYGGPTGIGVGGALRGGAVNGAIGAGRWAAGAAMGVVGSAVRGMGLNLDMGQHMASAIDLEKRATDISNAAYMPGKSGAAGIRQDAGQLQREARQVGADAALDPNKAMEGLQAFVGKTGDLETGRAILADMAKLSRATGTNLEDMVNAAGDVANGLGDTDNKAQKVSDVMRAIAAQGKVGAVEIKDLATQMAKVQAASGGFEGDGSANIAKLNAIAQMSRSRGGSASASQAATSTLSFANTFSKGKRIKAFDDFGVSIQGAGGKTRDPMEIIKDSIRAAGSKEHGGMAQFDMNMNKMFMDTRARAGTKGFEQIFKENGGGEAGIEAVAAAMRELEGATMSQAEVSRSFNKSMETTEAKTQAFNNAMSGVAADMKDVLAPALVSLAPAVLGAAKEFASLVAWMTGSPFHANSKNDSADAANAGAEMRGALKDMKPDAQGRLTGTVRGDTVTKGTEAEKALEAEILKKQRQLNKDKKLDRDTSASMNFVTGGGFALAGKLTGISDAKDDKRKAQENELKRLQDDFAKLHDTNKQVAAALQTGVLRVEVVKQPAPAAPLPAVNDAGRTGNPAAPVR